LERRVGKIEDQVIVYSITARHEEGPEHKVDGEL